MGMCRVWLEVDGEAVVAAQGAFARWGFADSVRDCCSFGSERVVFEAELSPGLLDGAFGVAEVGFGSCALRGGAEGAELVVGGMSWRWR